MWQIQNCCACQPLTDLSVGSVARRGRRREGAKGGRGSQAPAREKVKEDYERIEGQWEELGCKPQNESEKLPPGCSDVGGTSGKKTKTCDFGHMPHRGIFCRMRQPLPTGLSPLHRSFHNLSIFQIDFQHFPPYSSTL